MTRTSVPLIRRVRLKKGEFHPPLRRAAAAVIGEVLTFFDYDLIAAPYHFNGGFTPIYEADIP